MNPRTKIIVFIIVILLIVLIFGVGVGVKKGWFAGLADVITQQTGGPTTVKVTVVVKDNDQNPVNGANIILTKPEKFAKEDGYVNCTPDGSLTSNSNPIARQGQEEYPRGTTGQDGVNGEKTFEVSDAVNVNYLRLIRGEGGYRSCAFVFASKFIRNGTGSIEADTDYNPLSVVKFWNVRGVNNQQAEVTINYTLRASGVGTPPNPPPPADTGTITGYVKTMNSQNQLVGVPGVRATTEGNKSGTTDTSGKYTISGLTKRTNPAYVIQFSYDWACHYQAPPDIAVIVNNTNVDAMDVVLARGGVPAGKGKIEGYVKKLDVPQDPIAGARVSLLINPGLPVDVPNAQTDVNGYYSFCPLNPTSIDKYIVNVAAEGYEYGHKDNISLAANETKGIDFNLAVHQAPPPAQAFNIAGSVKDAVSKLGINGATVTLYDQATNQPVRKVNADGSQGDIVTAQTSNQSPVTGAARADGIFILDGISVNLSASYIKASYRAGRYLDNTINISAGTRQVGVTEDYSTSRPIYLVRDFESPVAISGAVNFQSDNMSEAAGKRLKIFALKESDGTRKDLGESAKITNPQVTPVRFPESGSINVPTDYLATRIKICAEYRSDGGNIYVGCYRSFGSSDDWIQLMPGNPPYMMPNGDPSQININLSVHTVSNKVFVFDENGTVINSGAKVTMELIKDQNTVSPPGKVVKDTDSTGLATFEAPNSIDFSRGGYSYRFTADGGPEYIAESKETSVSYDGQMNPDTITFNLKRVGAATGKLKVQLMVYEQLDGVTPNQKNAAHNYWASYADAINDKTSFKDQFTSGLNQFLGNDILKIISRIFSRLFLGIDPIQLITQVLNLAHVDLTTDAPTPFIKEDFQFRFENGQPQNVMRRKTTWKIEHANTAGVTWDQRMNVGQENQKNIYNIEIDLANLPQNFERMKVEQKRAALAAYLLSQGLAINKDSDNWISYSGPTIPKVQNWGVNCNKNRQTEQTECYVRILFKLTLNPDFLSAMSKGAKLITVPTQTQSQGGQGDGANNANASSVDSTTTDKTQSITPALPVGIKIKGPNINNNYALNQTLIVSGLPVATYTLTTVAPNDATYKIDSRQNTFQIQDANTMTEVATKICYSDTAYQENGMFKTLGPYSSGYYTMMTSATNRASQAISKAGISNIVYSGGTDRNSTYYATTAINFCQGTNSQDKSISGRSIVVSDGLLSEIWNNNYGSGLDQQRDTAAVLNYKAGEVVYNNELRTDSKASWSNIIHAINLEPDGDKIMAYVSEASGISDFLPSDISAHPEKIYGMTVASIDNTTLLEMRCSQMSERSCNITKAMIQFANKTINNRNTYPAAIDISITPLNAERIARGVWMQSIFNHLSATQKWTLKYAELIARIKRGGLGNVINAFNNWVDSLLGNRDTGNVTAFVFQDDQPVSTAIVTIGDEKVGYTDSTGRVSISGITTGTNTISVKNRNTGQDYNLETPGLTVNIVKNQTATVTIRLSQ